MRLVRLQKFMNEKGWKYKYTELDDLGSIDFELRGLKYYIWEFNEGEAGAESNIETAGRSKDYYGDYQKTMIDFMKDW